MNHVRIERKTLTYVAIAQGAAGTTVLAAAESGKKHKVVSCFGTLTAAGTVKFTATGDLTGAMSVGETGGFVMPSGMDPWFETESGVALSLVTTGGAFKGVIAVLTES